MVRCLILELARLPLDNFRISDTNARTSDTNSSGTLKTVLARGVIVVSGVVVVVGI